MVANRLSGQLEPLRRQIGASAEIGIEVLLIAGVMFTALAFGEARVWAIWMFEFSAATMLMLWVTRLLVSRSFEIRIPPSALPIIGLLVYGLMQSLEVTEGGLTRSLSRDPQATRGAITVLLFLLIVFLVATNSFLSRERLGAIANFLVVYGLALAVLAFLYGYFASGIRQGLRAPFSNRNHFAGYMELLAPLPIALLGTDGAGRAKQILYVIAAAAMGVAVLGSLSRGGMISWGASLGFILIFGSRLPDKTRAGGERRWDLAGRLRVWRSSAPGMVIIGMAIPLGLMLIGARPLVHRLAETVRDIKRSDREDFTDGRERIWKNTLAIIRANPALGVGLGAFPSVYETYSDASVAVGRAHNDYLQVLADAGVVGGALALWFLIAMFRAIRRSLRSTDPLLARLALGSGAGILAILVHSAFDYNLQVLPTSLLFLVISGVISCIGRVEANASIS